MTLERIKTTAKGVGKKFSRGFHKFGLLFLGKSKTFSDKANEKFLRGLDAIEKRTNPENHFMADTSAQQVKGASFFSHLTLWIILLFFIIALIWAKLAILDEVTVGEGKVIPASQVQVIQNLEGGIVKKIFVHEGDVVKAGQVLMQLDETHFISDYHEARLKGLALETKIARLNAVIDDKPFVISPEIEVEAPDLVAREKAQYLSQEGEQKQLHENYSYTKQEYDLTKPLLKTGAASNVELLHLERQMSDIQQQIDASQSKALEELNTAKADLLGVKASLAQYKDRVARTTVRSPVKGIVKQIKINTVGGVSQPGMDLMEIVPLEDTLLVEAQIKPKDIGFLHIGQSAMVKISAYDFSIYGGLEGKVEEISADSITNQKGESFYITRVRTKRNYLRTPKNPLYIIPGMMASVDILTGRKSVLDYLLKPILKAKQDALRER